MSIKTFGLKSFREAVDYNIELAEKVERFIRRSPNWEIISPATIGIINFRFNPMNKDISEDKLDELNQKISQEIINSEEALMVTTILLGKVVLRICLINPRTTLQDVKQTLMKCHEIAHSLV